LTTERARLALPLLLPEIPDTRDACVARLEEMLEGREGITHTHVVDAEVTEDAVLCLHYDPEVLSFGDIERIATSTGAMVTERYGHAVLPIHAVSGEDAG